MTRKNESHTSNISTQGPQLDNEAIKLILLNTKVVECDVQL